MGTFVVLVVLISVVALIVRGIVRDKKEWKIFLRWGLFTLQRLPLDKKAKAVFHAACSDNHKFQVIRRAWFKMNQHTSVQQKQENNQQKYERTQMQREIVIQRLKEQGCRITKQRMVLLDIILNENCSSCKEIYYKASRIDPKIGDGDRVSHDQYLGGDRCDQQKEYV